MQITIADFLSGIECALVDARTWNGWTCPHFTRAQADALVRAWRAAGCRAEYDGASDVYRFWHQDEPEPDSYAADVDGTYPIGAYGWTWQVED